MKKIPTIFERDWDGDKSRVTEKHNPLCEWVFKGEGVATRKWDGTATMIREGKFYARFEAKDGRRIPDGFIACETDHETGKTPGWIPVTDEPQFKWHREAYKNFTKNITDTSLITDGTFEAVGPHFQGNPEGMDCDCLVRHGVDILPEAPRTFASLAAYFATNNIEGIVWHHPDGRMAKIKARDFGIKRGL